LANGQKFHDVDAAFTAFVLGHKRLWPVKSISQLALSKACGFARLDHKLAKGGARLPSIYGTSDWVRSGGLISYGPNFATLFARAAELTDRILRGTRPSDIPVEQPTKFELVINLNTAKALGLTVPPMLLARADEVIE